MGDDPVTDIAGARAAGLSALLLDRSGRAPDSLLDLSELAGRLEASGVTPPVARDPALRVPGTHLLVVAGVVLVTSLVLGSVQSALVPSNADVIYSPTAMLLTSLSYVVIGAAVLWAARQTGDPRRALGLVAPPSWPRALGLALADGGRSARRQRRARARCCMPLVNKG